MSRFTRQNLRNIQYIFEDRTGVSVSGGHRPLRRSGRRLLILAAVVACILLTAFAYPIFSPLNGDALSLRGIYEGQGIVSVQVVNGSDKPLRFQTQAKLMSRTTGEELGLLEGDAAFQNTEFAPHSSGVMTLDLNGVCPAEELERSGRHYYLLLTNQDFLFGQDWMCDIFFDQPDEPAQVEENVPQSVRAGSQNLDGIPETLRSYWESSYMNEVPAWNPAHMPYMEAVQALLSRQEGTLVRSTEAWLKVGEAENAVFDEALPADMQRQLVTRNFHTLDTFRRMVGTVFPGDGWDCAMEIGVVLPQKKGDRDGGIGDFQLLYYFVYNTAEVRQPGAYAFIAGRVLSFDEMLPYQVYGDEKYLVYDMTDFFYTDLDAYIDDFLAGYGGGVYVDDQIRRRIHNVYDYYRNPDNLQIQIIQMPNG